MKVKPEELNLRTAHRLTTAAIAPRPIAFVSTVGEDGVFNLAPYSAFAPMSAKPAMVCFSVMPRRSGVKKDTLRNIEFSRDFVINVVDETLAEAMNKTAADFPPDVDEFAEAGLTAVPSALVKAPRLQESPVNMECRVVQILQFGQEPFECNLIIGKIVLVHVRDDVCTNGEIDMSRLKAIGRLGGDFYCRTTDMFEMLRPESGKP